MTCNGRSDIGEAVALADRRRARRARNEDRNLFAGVIAAGPCWIATVIGGDDKKVSGLQPLH